jgi:CheY-like chemotaxis protein
VLVVDDEDMVRSVVVRGLKREGFHIEEARDGSAGLARAREAGPFDLLVTDMVMPGMGGADLAAAVVALHPKTRVLFLSGFMEQTATPLPEGAALLEKLHARRAGRTSPLGAGRSRAGPLTSAHARSN